MKSRKICKENQNNGNLKKYSTLIYIFFFIFTYILKTKYIFKISTYK